MSITLKDPRIEITSDVRVLTRSDGKSVIFDRRLPLGTNAGVFENAEGAAFVARAKYAHEMNRPKGPAKMASSDEELFAAMKRAMANGFAKHEPAYSAEELRALEAR